MDKLNRFKVTAEFHENGTVQQEIDAESGQTVSRTWNKARSLGSGFFGQVRQEARQDGRGDWHYRAVKVCKISALRRANVDYMREVSALAALSSSRYSGLFVNLSAWWTDTTTLYFAMEYISNGDLSAYINSKLTEEDAKEIAADILSGLNVMHQEGITHRDIKPQNILVVQKRPESAKWWVKIGDFGISKRIVEGSETSLRTALGTKPYCAPEVLGYLDPDSDNSAYDSKVDIWSLGCVLFNLGTRGQNPFTEPDLVRYCDGSLPFRWLEQAILFNEQGKSLIASLLQPKPNNRPIASDALQHPWFTSRSEPLAIANIPSGSSFNVTPREPEETQSDLPRNWNSFLQPTSSPLASPEKNHSSTLALKPEVLITKEQPKNKQWNEKIALKGHDNPINAVAFSPDGKLVASASGNAALSFERGDNTVRLWDVTTGQLKGTLKGHKDPVSCVAFSPDNKMIVSGSLDEMLIVWTLPYGVRTSTMKGYTSGVHSAAWSPSGSFVASGHADGCIKLWEVNVKEVSRSLNDGATIITDLAFVGEDQILISGSRNVIRIWDAERKAVLRKIRVDNEELAIGVSPDNRYFAFWSAGNVEIWNTENWRKDWRKPLSSTPWPPDSIAWSANGRMLAIGCDRDIALFDPRSGRILQTLKAHTDLVKSVAFSPKAAIVASGSKDGTSRLWDLEELQLDSIYL